DRPRAVYVTDEASGAEIDSGSAFFVRSAVVTNPVTRNRVHTFRDRADAEDHARAYEGEALTGVRRPFSFQTDPAARPGNAPPRRGGGAAHGRSPDRLPPPAPGRGGPRGRGTGGRPPPGGGAGGGGRGVSAPGRGPGVRPRAGPVGVRVQLRPAALPRLSQ